MLKEILTLHALSSKLNKLRIKTVEAFLARCDDNTEAENMRQHLEIDVLPEQWQGALAVIRKIFKYQSKEEVK